MASPLSTAPVPRSGAAPRWVVLCSATPWSSGAHRQHALAHELAGSGDYRVLFVDPPSHATRWDFGIRQVGESLWQVSVASPLPFGRQVPVVNRAGRRWTARRLRRWLDARPGDRLLWLDEDIAAPLAGQLGESAVVYDTTDLDWTFTRRWNRRHLRRSLEAALGAADLVLASSAALPDRMPASPHRPVVLANACDPEHFRPDGPVSPLLAALPRPRIGYLGAVDTRALDADLVVGAARARPDWTFVLVGPGTDAGRARLGELPNVHVHGPVPYDEAPAVVRGFDVATIPYRVGGLVDYVHPKKLYEYLAAGRPVVSTDLPALAGIDAPVRVTSGVDGFVDAVEAALGEADDPAAVAVRRTSALANTWAQRGATLHDLLERVGR